MGWSGGGRSLEPLAAGAVFVYGAGLLPGLRLFSAVRPAPLAAGHLGRSVPPGERLEKRPVPPPGPGYGSGLHHGYGVHRRGGHRSDPGRAGGGVLDVGVRAAGHDDRLWGEAAVRPLSAPRSRGRDAGRAHVLPPGRPGLEGSRPVVHPGLSPRYTSRGRPGPVLLHRPGAGIQLRPPPAGHGAGHRRPGRSGPDGRGGAHRPGVLCPGARHGPALFGSRGLGAAVPGHGPARSAETDFSLCPLSPGRSGRRSGLDGGLRSALRGGPGGVHQRGGLRSLRHGPRSRRPRLSRPPGLLGDVRGGPGHSAGLLCHRSGHSGQRRVAAWLAGSPHRGRPHRRSLRFGAGSGGALDGVPVSAAVRLLLHPGLELLRPAVPALSHRG